jgi:hypothetical protein
MKQIKIIKDEQLLEQISGGANLSMAKSMSPLKAALTAIAVVIGIKVKTPAPRKEYQML